MTATASTPTSRLPSLKAVGLACRRGNRLLFSGLDLEVAPGQIVWVRGPNGSGKTSLLRLAAGLSTPEEGQMLWGDAPVRRSADYRARLVYVGHANALKDDLSASESLQFMLRLHGRPSQPADVQAALERIGVQSRRHAMVRTLSQGQRRRVALARLAAETTPSLWILDEPFDALDTDGIDRLDGLLREHRDRGGSVLLTSHQSLNADVLRPREVDLGAWSR